MKTTVKQTNTGSWFVHLSILLTVTLAIGIYLVGTTVLIAKDGVTFIEYARQMEQDAAKTVMGNDQHPGYPWMILGVHKAVDSICGDESILCWVYSGQSITLGFRVLAVGVLYFIGAHLFGARLGFWGALILVILPKPAQYGSDVLSDWPYLFFMLMGVLLLLKGAAGGRWWLFGVAGLSAGAGYLIRPECVQVVLVGGMWLGLEFVWQRCGMKRGKVLLGAVLLFVGFMAMAGPYMKFKGAVFPKKKVGQFAQNPIQQINSDNTQHLPQAMHRMQFASFGIGKGWVKLLGNIGGSLMWVFVPGMIIGMHKSFRWRKWRDPESFFVMAIVGLNVLLMIWLYRKHGYMSSRHTLTMLVVLVLYVPVGLEALGVWCKGWADGSRLSMLKGRDERFWFITLVVIGVCVCAPKLLRPIRVEKQGYRMAAAWLEDNTESTDVIAVDDIRVNFYAERQGVVYGEDNVPGKADYVVMADKKDDGRSERIESLGEKVFEYEGDSKKRGAIVIRVSE